MSRAVVGYGEALVVEVMGVESNLLKGSDNFGGDDRSSRRECLGLCRVALNHRIQNNSSSAFIDHSYRTEIHTERGLKVRTW